MSYQPDTATSPINLLQQLCTWLQSIGWTQDMSQADGSGWRAHLHKGSNYANLRASVNETVWATEHGATNGLHLYLGTGFSAGSGWRAQPGAPVAFGGSPVVGVACNLGSLVAYHFLADATGDNVVVIVEAYAGVYHHLAWGQMVKAGAWTGGAYFNGTVSGYWSDLNPTATDPCPFAEDAQQTGNIFVRADVDSVTGIWITNCATTKSGYQGMTISGQTKRIKVPLYSGSNLDNRLPHYQTIEALQYTTLNGLATLLPVHLYVERDVSPGGVSLLGQVPGIYKSIATSKGYGIGTDYALGPDTYLLFPNFAIKKV